jgi:hypothetical protein
MSGKQRAVLWLGIILIALNIVAKWSEIKSVIFTGPGGAPSSGGSSSSGSGGSNFGIGSLPFPFNVGGLLNSATPTPATNTVTAV